jgi:hypothetical protein
MDEAPVTTKEVEVPEMNIKGGSVFVRMLDADGVSQLATFADQVTKGSETSEIEFLYKVAALTTSDEAGARLYGDDELDAIKRLPFKVLERVAEAALELNGMDDASAEARTQELSRPLAGSSSSSRGNGNAPIAKRRPVRPRKKSLSASR